MIAEDNGMPPVGMCIAALALGIVLRWVWRALFVKERT